MENSIRKLDTDTSLVPVDWRPQFDEPSGTFQPYQRGLRSCIEASNAVQIRGRLRNEFNKI